MKCPQCLHENPDDAKFCNECASKLEITCSECGKLNPPGSKFCNECAYNLTVPAKSESKPLSLDEKLDKIQRYLPKGLTEKILAQRDRIEGERKLVTVMFCDMEGFTTLSERLGPEEAYGIMDQVYEILIHKVHDYEGTVNEMTGDGIMALFGAPIALEDAPQRAIRSAHSIHREMVRFSEQTKRNHRGMPPRRMRIGIHTGPVVVGTLGNTLRVEFKAVGDTVNLASRMEQLAEPGATYVTEEVFRLTEGFFQFEALGQKEVKGKAQPVQVYRVIAPSTRKTRFDVSALRGLTPFVGRERELELLLDCFERSKGGRGQAVSIVADAGVGKSRLLYEFRKAVTSEDATFLEGKCLSYSRGIAYHLHIDVLKANFEITEGDGDSEIKEKVRNGLKIVKADGPSILPYLLELLSVKESGIDEVALSPAERKNRIVEGLKQVVLNGSGIRPVILAYEDLHWVDKSSEDVLKSILESIPGARVLLIFTYRPEYVHTWGGKSYHSQVNLNRLSNRESLLMAGRLLGTEYLESGLEEFILEKTEGIPFFIEEFIKSLRDLKVIERKNDTYRIAKDIQTVTIPSTIQDVIMARVDSLPERAKGILHTASVVGREFSYDLIDRLIGLPEKELLSHLSVLRDSELLYERGVYPHSTYIFKHALTQEVAYDSLLLKRKKELHEKIAQAVEEIHPEGVGEFHGILAYHYVRSANTDKALLYLDLANQKAAKLCAMEDATAYFDEAMQLLDTLPETDVNKHHRISLLVNQFYVFLLQFQTDEYYDLLKRYEPIAVRLEDQGMLGAFYTRLGFWEQLFGLFDQATRTLTKAIDLCKVAEGDEYMLTAYGALEWNYFYLGAYDRIPELKEQILLMMKHMFNRRLYVDALSPASWAYSNLGRWEEALGEGLELLSVGEKFSLDSFISFAAWIISIAYNQKGDLVRALEYATLGVQKAPTPADKAWAERSLGWIQCRAGETDKGIEVLENLASIVQTEHYKPFELHLKLWLGEGYWLARKYEKAKQTLDALLEIAEPYGLKFYIGSAQRILGEVARYTDPAHASSHFDKSIDVLRDMKAENELALAYAGYGRLHKQKGNISQAREYLTKALEIFDRLGTLIQPEKVKKELAELPKT